MGKTSILSKTTKLWSGQADVNATLNLDNSIYNYDQLVITVGINGNSGLHNFTINVNDIVINGKVFVASVTTYNSGWDNNYVELKFLSETSIKITSTHTYTWTKPYVVAVYGVR